MPNRPSGETRALALVGPTGAGKTALMEAMLQAAGVTDRKVADTSPEAKARGHSVDLNFARFEFMGDGYAVVDCPGSLELAADADAALAAVDLAVIVAEPDPVRAVLLQPVLRQIETLGTPRALFINKMDQARGPLDDLLAALAPVSGTPLVARQLPILENDRVTGYVDLALERAFVGRAGQASSAAPLTAELAVAEADARFHMLEQLADYDDELMEQLLNDTDPAPDLVFADLVREMNEGLITPVFFGSAHNGFGIRRLLKALRHETPPTARAAARLGLTGPAAAVIKTSWAGQAGKLSYARVFGRPLVDGAEMAPPNGERVRAGGLSAVQGAGLRKVGEGAVGDIVAIGKVEGVRAGDALGLAGNVQALASPPPRPPLHALAIAAADRRDDVRLSGALARILEEDPGLSVMHDKALRQTLLMGQGEGHVRLALERLERRYGVAVATARPATPYRETIIGGVTQRGRHKKQTGGHGQFADVTLSIQPLDRDEGVVFVNRITGGVVPRQWIPAVEQGVRAALEKGPLGFPVVDLEVSLVDGAFHAVDSSEMAFRTAGRIGVDEGLKACGSRLLEPIERLTVQAPATAIAAVNATLAARRGQILGFGPREGWAGWEQIEAYLPHSQRLDLIAELRSVTQGLGTFTARFDHLAELTGRAADDIVAAARAV